LKTTTSKAVLGSASMALAMALVLATIALSPGHADAVDADVAMQNTAFVPSTVNIGVGDSVTWTNMDAGIPHTTTSNTGVWDSNTLNNGQSFTHTFTQAGSFPYFCEVHPTQMTGTVIVGQQATATATTTTATATTTTATATTTTATATATPTTPASTATPTATATTPAATATTTTTAVAPATTVAPGPPATGSGTAPGTNYALLILAAGLAALGLSGGAFVAVRRNS
jgi:plastocyanin